MSAPGANAGEQTLRLDADRTRDDLADALTELRQRLGPKELAKSTLGSLRRYPWQVTGGIAATAATITGIVLLSQRSKRRG